MDAHESFCRANPSPRYRALLALYREMHLNGDVSHAIAPEAMFAGGSLGRQITEVKAMTARFGARTLLDYGCGKAQLYSAGALTFKNGQRYASLIEYWGLEQVALYDPAYPPLAEPPQGQYDGVISTDVLEHCPEEDLPWILAELYGHARKFVFANVACYSAKKCLPNGENAHTTVRDPAWWRAVIEPLARAHPGVVGRFVFESIVEGTLRQDAFELGPNG